jgi:hypothetical protein
MFYAYTISIFVVSSCPLRGTFEGFILCTGRLKSLAELYGLCFAVKARKHMQRIHYITLALIAGLLSSCELVGDIFEAGIWTGLIAVALVIALVIWLITKFRR